MNMAPATELLADRCVGSVSAIDHTSATQKNGQGMLRLKARVTRHLQSWYRHSSFKARL